MKLNELIDELKKFDGKERIIRLDVHEEYGIVTIDFMWDNPEYTLTEAIEDLQKFNNGRERIVFCDKEDRYVYGEVEGVNCHSFGVSIF